MSLRTGQFDAERQLATIERRSVTVHDDIAGAVRLAATRIRTIVGGYPALCDRIRTAGTTELVTAATALTRTYPDLIDLVARCYETLVNLADDADPAEAMATFVLAFDGWARAGVDVRHRRLPPVRVSGSLDSLG